MKYKDLPSEKLIQKLIATSFETPSANREVYDWCEAVLKHIKFIENERVKLVQKYGKDDGNGNFTVTEENKPKFFSEFKDLIEMEINEAIPDCPVKQSWFEDSRCSYAKNKDFWITPAEIGQFDK